MPSWKSILQAKDPKLAFADHLIGLLAQTPAERKLAAPLAASIESIGIVDGKVLRATFHDYRIDCAKPSTKKLPAGLPKSLQTILKAHEEIRFSDVDGASEWLGLEVGPLDTYDWPLTGPSWKGVKGPVYQCLRKYSDVYVLHPKERTARGERAVVLYDHEVGVGRPLPKTVGQIFLGHVAKYLKLAELAASAKPTKPGRPAKLARKPKIEDGRLDYENDKKLASIAMLAAALTAKQRAAVTMMDLSRCALASTAGIEAFPNLTGLRLDDNVIADTTGIEQLTKLVWLSLMNNRVTALRCAAATQLARVKLDDNRVASLDALDLPPGLRELDLTRNAVTSLAPIPRYAELRELKMFSNRIEVIERLEALPHLEKVVLHGNPVKDVTPASVAAIREGRARGLDALIADDVEQRHGLVPIHWLLAAPCSEEDLQTAMMAAWNPVFARMEVTPPWTIATGTAGYVYLTSPDLPAGFSHLFSQVARVLSANGARAYMLDLRPGERRRTGVHGWECYVDAKMVFEGEKLTSEELRKKLGCE